MRPILATLVAAVVSAGAAQAARLTEAPLVDAAWLAENLDNENLLVIDVRDPSSESAPVTPGHIPGAVHAPYTTYGWRAEVNGIPGMLPPVEEIAAKIGALGIDAQTHVVIVPQGTDSTEFGSATRVYWTLKVLGHEAVSILDGGANAWLAAGGETVPEPASPEPADFIAEFQPDLLADAGEVASAIEGEVALVDGRPYAQFSGSQKAPVARVAGTIPTAVNIPHDVLYNSSFVDADQIATLRSAVGLSGIEPTIAFCNTGHWASIAWFALSEVDGNARVAMYDGSMAEWTRDESRPVE